MGYQTNIMRVLFVADSAKRHSNSKDYAKPFLMKNTHLYTMCIEKMFSERLLRTHLKLIDHYDAEIILLQIPQEDTKIAAGPVGSVIVDFMPRSSIETMMIMLSVRIVEEKLFLRHFQMW